MTGVAFEIQIPADDIDRMLVTHEVGRLVPQTVQHPVTGKWLNVVFSVRIEWAAGEKENP